MGRETKAIKSSGELVIPLIFDADISRVAASPTTRRSL
jgi:hypothetical protein